MKLSRSFRYTRTFDASILERAIPTPKINYVE